MYPPLIDGGRTETSNIDSSISNVFELGIPVSPTHTKTSWQVIESSCPIDSWGFLLCLQTVFDYRSALIDLAIGSGTEQIIIPNLYVSAPGDFRFQFLIPIFVPEGEEISIRGQADGGVDVEPSIVWFGHGAGGGPFPLMNEVREMGADTSDTTLVSVDPGGTPNSYGAYTEIEDSTPIDFEMLMVVWGNQQNTARSDYDWTFKVAVGSEGNEEDIAEGWISCDDRNDGISPCPFVILQDIPAGSRLSVTLSCSGNDATDRTVGAQILGFTGSGLTGGRSATSNLDSSNSIPNALTLPSSPLNTKTSYIELESSVPFDSIGFELTTRVDHVGVRALVDVAVGAGTEQIIVPDLYIDSPYGRVHQMYFPIFIPEGEEVSLRGQSHYGAVNLYPMIRFFGRGADGGAFPVLNEVREMGSDDTDTTLVQVDPGGTPNSYGAYTEIIDSTPIDFQRLMIVHSKDSNQTRADVNWTFKVAVGSEGFEEDIYEDACTYHAWGDCISPDHFSFYEFIPTGSRLSIALSSDETDASDRLMSFQILGFGG